ncbi:fructose-1,6-bisphosphatase [Candidatus Bathyarchaeota archaeon]|nr:MAG: fructose-1,6-bisphosphatase [Candidatus Bathyarchaeota archaeon]
MLLSKHLKGYEKDIVDVVLGVAEVSKTISRGFITRQGKTDTSNVYGEQQAAMDKWADELLINELGGSGLIRYLASEEQPELLVFESESDIALSVDPLDGSSLLGVNLAMGTIVGIHRGGVLKPGEEMVGAVYIIYGPLTVLVYSLGDGVHEFALNADGDFILQKENMTIGSEKRMGPGAARNTYLPFHEEYISKLEADGYKIRFSGSFVADVHQILHKGGVFTYPGYQGSVRGKLRLLFECAPMGYIVTQAGGAVSDGYVDLLSIVPESISERVPVYIGGKREINLIMGLPK